MAERVPDMKSSGSGISPPNRDIVGGNLSGARPPGNIGDIARDGDQFNPRHTGHLVEIDGLGFDQFYRQQRSSIVRAVALTVGDLDLAAEATDEAMVRAYQRWSTVSEHDRPAGWVYRVALNYCHSRFRRVTRKMRYTAGLSRRDDSATDVTFADRIGDARLLLAVQALPYDQRAVIVTRVLMSLSEAEAAELLGTKPGTIKSRLSRALTTLRSALPEYTTDWSELASSSHPGTSTPSNAPVLPAERTARTNPLSNDQEPKS